jgi:8-oxo-dGTP pyrophosphatase MutT (NUDIX family)
MRRASDIFGLDDIRQRARANLAQTATAGMLDDYYGAVTGDFDLNPAVERKADPAAFTPAAVLVPITSHGGTTGIVLTQRSHELPTHAGQISFPGGKIDPSDKDPLDTALRETHEEIGLERSFVEVLGFLDPYETGTGYRILPVIGAVRSGFRLVPEPGEVDEIFDVPFSFLMSPENHKRHTKTFSGIKRHFHAMPYGERYIWGATAGIIKNLYHRLYGG